MPGDKITTISNHGRITIPANYRNKMGLHDGLKVMVLEDEGGLRIIPILDVEAIRKMSVTAAEMEQIYNESKDEDRELENG